jgi:hypothetical protein
MRSRCRHVYLLSLLTTLLTLSASADDFYLVRIVCPLAAPTDPLLLDDPNSDFLSASKCVADDGCHNDTLTVACPEVSGVPQTFFSARLEISSHSESNASRAQLNPPLLC